MDFFCVLAAGFVMKLVLGLFAFCSVLLVLIVLVQKGKGGGLSGALGGAGGAGSIMGTKTGDFLTWVTITLVALFLLLAIALAKYYKPSVEGAGPEQQQPQQQSAPVENDSGGQGGATETPVGGANSVDG